MSFVCCVGEDGAVGRRPPFAQIGGDDADRRTTTTLCELLAGLMWLSAGWTGLSSSYGSRFLPWAQTYFSVIFLFS